MTSERTVLFVDDDEIFLQLLEMSLKDEAYCKHFAASGAEALDILQREQVHVMIVDVVMPKMGGVDLLKIVNKNHPDIVTMVMSEYAQPRDIMTAMYEQGIYKYIAKPWKLDADFVAIVREAVDNYDLLNECKNIFAELRRCSDLEKRCRMTAISMGAGQVGTAG